jgi:hypothetical protein
MWLLTEKEKNEKLVENFPFVHNSAVFLCKLFENKKKLTIGYVIRKRFLYYYWIERLGCVAKRLICNKKGKWT